MERELKNERGGRERVRNNTHTTTTASRNIRNKKTLNSCLLLQASLLPTSSRWVSQYKNSNNSKNRKGRRTALPTIQRGLCGGESGLQATPHC